MKKEDVLIEFWWAIQYDPAPQPGGLPPHRKLELSSDPGPVFGLEKQHRWPMDSLEDGIWALRQIWTKWGMTTTLQEVSAKMEAGKIGRGEPVYLRTWQEG